MNDPSGYTALKAAEFGFLHSRQEPPCVSHFCWVCMFKGPHGWNTSIMKIEAHQRCVLLSWVAVNQFL